VLGMMGYTNIEGAVLLSKAPGWFKLILKLAAIFLRPALALRSRRSRRLTMGNALIGRLRKSLMDLNVPIWLNCPAGELLVEGAVVGVLARA
jgi:3-oxosteroid 1-dehydrogenase